MNGGQVQVGGDVDHVDGADGQAAVAPGPWLAETWEGEAPERRSWQGPLGVVALVLAFAWIAGLLLWSVLAGVAATPATVAALAAAACSVPLLLGLGWLVLVIGSGRYADRLTESARTMHAETDALSRTIGSLDLVIEQRRVALAEQARSLAGLGDAAVARLEAIGSRLSDEIAEADRHARQLRDGVGAVEARLATLLATMPRVREEVAAVGEGLGTVVVSTTEQMAGLDARLIALVERGREAETIAGGAAQSLAAHLVRMDATSEAAGQRLTAVTAQMAGEVDALLGRTAQAVDESRKGIAAQGDAMLAMLGAHQAALDTAARDSAEGLAQRIEIVELVIDRVAKRLAEQRLAGDAMASDLDRWLVSAEERLAVLQRDGTARAQALAQSITALGGSADAMKTAIREGDDAAVKAIASAETLLIALDSAAREMDETLPAALQRLDARVEASRGRVAASKPELMALVTAAESTHAAVDGVATALADQRRNAELVATTLTDGLARGRDKVAGLEHAIDAAIERTDAFVESAAPRLLEALLRVRDTADTAADKARDTLAEVIPEAAHALEVASEAAFRRAAGAGVQDQVAAVAEVAEAAVAAATRAADRLEDQLARVSEASARLETRMAAARSEREADVRDSFARRAAQLIEAMNSAAIDLSRSLAPDVSDTAWSAYLKGDRGVFTRRAVRLLDAGEQQAVATKYDGDPAFRDAVNRYIHDFEAMLRAVLAQTEGAPMGVILLSSDIGKLYVALAQAIERLR
jgi:hypothetical protein